MFSDSNHIMANSPASPSSQNNRQPKDEIIISVRNLTKTFRLFSHPGDRIKQFFSLGIKQYHREFNALNNISFDIRKGETIGIIGRNGSGKSTLLQLICGILKPTSGSVRAKGSVSALLELGAGFNPEFTGRENVYFQGALMGFTRKQMDQRFGQIVAFAGIGEFIDQPVRTYSSGMFVRLAFAAAVHVDPEILVVDEALGVGDAEFQERSISRMNAMRRNGTTILFVSHSIPAIRNFCQRVIWLNDGVIKQVGSAIDISMAYQEEIRNFQAKSALHGAESPLVRHEMSNLHPSGRGKLISIIRMTVDHPNVAVGKDINLNFELQFSSEIQPPTEFGLGVIIRDEAGTLVTLFNTLRDDIILTGAVHEVSLHLPRAPFVPGRYWVSANICDRDVMYSFDTIDRCVSFDVTNESSRAGIPRWEGQVACEHTWLWKR